MDKEILALVVEQGTQIVSMLLRNKDVLATAHKSETRETPSLQGQPLPVAERSTQKSTAIATGCIPCSLGHLGTCTGLLNEAMRFARQDGIASEEVIDRMNMCLDELNALERVDLRPEMMEGLPDWEKTLAEQSLTLSRSLRHDLEAITDVSALESVSAHTQRSRQAIGKAWFRERISRMPPEQRKQVEDELMRRAKKNEQEKEETIQ